MFYRICGVARPTPDVDSATTLGDDYATLAQASAQMTTTIAQAVRAVAEHNEGGGTDAFTARADEVARSFDAMTGAATRTSAAYRRSATVGAQASTAMDALNADATTSYWKALSTGATPTSLALLIQVVRNELISIETRAVSLIDEAFANLALPTQIPLSDKDRYGHVDPQITAAWSELSDAQRREVLQRMADAYADANGYPRITITFEDLDSGQTITWGDYSDSPQRLRLNAARLDDVHIINTVAHEMEHRGQYQGMGFRWPWQDERAGMSRAEAERWRQLNSDHVRSKGGPDYWDYYPNRPIEVHARQSGRDFVNSMSYEDFLGYL